MKWHVVWNEKMAYIKHPKHIPFEYSKITDNIYLGTNQCCKIHFDKSLLNQGIDADISLEKERLDTPFGVKYFLWLPVRDHTAPTQSQLKVGTYTIKSLVEGNIKVYVHCKRGHGRSPTLVAAYFILEGITVKEAIKNVKQKRGIHLRASQIKALEKFERSFKNEK